MSLHRFISNKLFLLFIGIILLSSSCNIIPNVVVWLKTINFEVDPMANKGEPFVCHIAVAYSDDLLERLQGMDAQGYFTNIASLEKTYKDSIEVFKYDIIPGKNRPKEDIKLRSYNNAKGAFIFAKYLTPGKFMESIGRVVSLTVRFLPHKMELVSPTDPKSILSMIKGKG